MASLGWLRESVNFPTPQSQTDTLVVPGRNSPIRYTQALGRVSDQPRSFEILLSMLGSRAAFNEKVSEAANRFAGQLSPGDMQRGAGALCPRYVGAGSDV